MSSFARDRSVDMIHSNGSSNRMNKPASRFRGASLAAKSTTIARELCEPLVVLLKPLKRAESIKRVRSRELRTVPSVLSGEVVKAPLKCSVG